MMMVEEVMERYDVKVDLSNPNKSQVLEVEAFVTLGS
jgi:hypothetical protein